MLMELVFSVYELTPLDVFGTRTRGLWFLTMLEPVPSS